MWATRSFWERKLRNFVPVCVNLTMPSSLIGVIEVKLLYSLIGPVGRLWV